MFVPYQTFVAGSGIRRRRKWGILLSMGELEMVLTRAGFTDHEIDVIGHERCLTLLVLGRDPNSQRTPKEYKTRESTPAEPLGAKSPVQSRNGPWLPAPATGTRAQNASSGE